MEQFKIFFSHLKFTSKIGKNKNKGWKQSKFKIAELKKGCFFETIPTQKVFNFFQLENLKIFTYYKHWKKNLHELHEGANCALPLQYRYIPVNSMYVTNCDVKMRKKASKSVKNDHCFEASTMRPKSDWSRL